MLDSIKRCVEARVKFGAKYWIMLIASFCWFGVFYDNLTLNIVCTYNVNVGEGITDVVCWAVMFIGRSIGNVGQMYEHKERMFMVTRQVCFGLCESI